MISHLLAQKPQQSPPLARIQLPPLRGLGRDAGRFDRGYDLVPCPRRHASHRSIRRGIEYLGGLVRCCRHRLAGDVEALLPDFHHRSAPTIGPRTISVWLSPLDTGGLLSRASLATPRGHRAGRRAREPHAAVAGGGEGVRRPPPGRRVRLLLPPWGPLERDPTGLPICVLRRRDDGPARREPL